MHWHFLRLPQRKQQYRCNCNYAASSSSDQVCAHSCRVYGKSKVHFIAEGYQLSVVKGRLLKQKQKRQNG